MGSRTYNLTVSIPDGGVSIVETTPSLPAPVPAPAPVPSPGLFLSNRGCNLAGGGTDWKTWGSAGPISGQHYLFMTTAEIDGLIAAGMNTFRLLFTWEAIYPAPWAQIATVSGNYKTYADILWSRVDYITSKGCTVILDIHGDHDSGFAAYRDVKVGSTYQGVHVEDMLADLWGQIATKYATRSLIAFGITNEPHDISATVWFAAAQNVVNAIRLAGSKSTIYCPGTNWTGAATWTTSNAPYWNIVDSAKNTVIQLHLYLDSSAGGGGTDIVSATIGVERIKAATDWARSTGNKLFLAEVGMSASNPLASSAWGNLHAYMLNNADVWQGFTFWAAGPKTWWSGYQFYCGTGSTQLALIQSALK